jgi:hypothetical protein
MELSDLLFKTPKDLGLILITRLSATCRLANIFSSVSEITLTGGQNSVQVHRHEGEVQTYIVFSKEEILQGVLYAIILTSSSGFAEIITSEAFRPLATKDDQHCFVQR